MSTWQQYEKGNVPKGDILRRIREEFGVDLNWLLTGIKNVKQVKPAPEDSKPNEYFFNCNITLSVVAKVEP
jgi:transcriptional regulator with XRE-family HTH domain